ncbi:MAG: pilus assembly protein PilY [Gammaproteobacteria bacterium]|nr:pilus assembly protein PilY [Gammaproteobacteria bacterium]MBU1489075.1 pilus assembly protein PilY [Gammaproteobacteria bacterium]MBU2066105.1 pilus assembly protein PilY [Gammaproteobacteria bacterium]MBU2139935.1 pilus assembly protein PilY [Gammaproteobacteria bacterium]MBU2218790.1 pilus assembly protein PilY [Gammaproteobacteria bacterium]
MKNTHHLRTVLTSCLAATVLLQSSISFADDTEIFFGGPSASEGIKPNVLFILDNSGSMAWRLDRDSTPTQTSHGPSRISVLKESFNDIISNTNNINVGVMALNPRSDYGNTRLVYPVENIDGPVGIAAATPEIIISADDASRQGSSTSIDSPTLVMGHINNHPGNTIIRDLGSTSSYSNNNSSYYLKGNYSCSVKISTARDYCDTGAKTQLNARSSNAGQTGIFLFRNLNIPANATIVSATLTLTPVNTQSAGNRPALNIKLENTKTPSAINDATLINDRDFSISKDFNSASLPTWTANTSFSIDVKTNLLDNLKARAPVADPIADLVLQIRSTTNRDYNYYVGDHAQAPVLNVVYSGGTNTSRAAGLRFQNVAVPQGATITSARIDFVPAGSDDRPVTFAVSAQAAGDATAFSATEDFTSRTKTSSVNWAAAEWRTENPPAYVEGPSVIQQAQEVVSNSSWCGNNSMAFFLQPTTGDGSRTTYSVDGSPLKPVLKITYEGGENGCLRPVLEARVTAPKNDARQYNLESCTWWGQCSTSQAVVVNEEAITLGSNTTHIGARYENLPIIRGAQVVDAQVIVRRSGTSGSANVTVHVEDTGNSSELLTNNNNLGSRAVSTGTACTLSGEESICSGTALTSALQTVFAKSGNGTNGWNDGNALSIILKPTANSGYSAVAYESSPAESIQLRLKLDTGGMGKNFRTVRTHVNSLVQGMNASGGTPIVPALYDGARYLSEKYHSGSSPSPMASSCQATHLVLLTDGKPEGSSNEATNGIASLAGSCSSSGLGFADERCARELVRWMANTDQSSFDGDNYILTHTVGFALDARGATEAAQIKTFLADLAREGGGGFYSAENASSLSKAFDQILQQVLATDTTFVSASAPVNTFNRQDNKDELYFSLFRPSVTDRWIGNLKRYGMATSNGAAYIVDRDGLPAIDTNTGFFRSDARSWWSASNDGSNVAAGGAASRLPTPNSRNLLTNVSTNTALTAITAANAELTSAKLGAANATERENLITFIRGYDPNDPSVERKSLGDPIHATPSMVTYACNNSTNGVCTDEKQSVIFGTNEGFVQMFDAATGVEQFAFMPSTLLPNIKRLRANAAIGTNTHMYGMDNTVVVWANDANKNGVITNNGTAENGEFVYAYATMGRGGRDIYALDITNPTSPSLLWQINGGSGNFARLGQTWSAPVKTKIKVGATITDVLVFGGGYDPDQDSATVRTADNQGNDLFIVNAKTGALIWSASSAGIGGMDYSIPSGVNVISLQTNEQGQLTTDPDGLAGQIFVGDMGGQVWRFIMKNGSSDITGGVFASVAGTDVASARRFYHEPELALINVKNKVNLTVNIGSGYRGHPLNKVIDDRFYSFRTEDLGGTSSTNSVLTEADLYDATSLTQATDAQREALLAKRGWYIQLIPDGEKVLSRPLVIAGNLYFNTYEPRANQNSCQAATGVTRAYQVSLLDSTALSTTRFVVSKGSSLPSNPQIYCKGNSCWVYNDPSQLVPSNIDPAICDESPDKEKCLCDNNPTLAECNYIPQSPRSYWIDEE